MLTTSLRKLLVLIALLGALGQAAAYAAPATQPIAVTATASEMDCADMDMAASKHDTTPCRGMTLACIAMMGCVSTPLVAAEPSAAAVRMRYARILYITIDAVLAGVTVEPEIFPPIA